MALKDQLKKSECELCHTALDEIIRLEAEIISMNKMAHRLRRPGIGASDWLRSIATKKSPMSAAGRALSQRPRA